MPYRAPVGDLLAALKVATGGRSLWPEVADGTAGSVLEGAAALAEQVLAPLDHSGDRAGVTLGAEGVRTAPGWREAYAAWIADGWNGVAAPEDAGGMGLSLLIHFACAEIWSGANLSFGLVPILTSGAVEALDRHAAPDLKRLYLGKLVSGAWTGTMNLTEPHAGSDLAGIATRASRRGDGTYAITGQKIFISFGDHDLTENIVHLVLARLPDAPPGTRGISLFLVPKFLIRADGSPGDRNDLRCAGLERKMGMHAAPTCTMSFGESGGATGYLIGEENRGLACMFTMMNNARLAVGIEGVAAAERATQLALDYARERRQGRGHDGAAAAIVEHPDVARMLMTMRASTAAARAICFRTAAALDEARRAGSAAERQTAANKAALLTPVAKAFSTDIANTVASLGVQVHGGTGYVEDTGAAQLMRDARIFAIYEGTNGIQAIDLAVRKLPLDQGKVLAGEIADWRDIVGRLRDSNIGGLGGTAAEVEAAIDRVERASQALVRAIAENQAAGLAVATPYLRLFGLACGAALLSAAVLQAQRDGATTQAVALARFFAENCLPETAGLERIVAGGGAALAERRQAWAEALADVA